MDRDKIRNELTELVRSVGYYIHKKQSTVDIEDRLINVTLNKILSLIEQEKGMMSEGEIKAELLAQYKIFDDYKDSRISIGKLRELIAKALLNKLPSNIFDKNKRIAELEIELSIIKYKADEVDVWRKRVIELESKIPSKPSGEWCECKKPDRTAVIGDKEYIACRRCCKPINLSNSPTPKGLPEKLKIPERFEKMTYPKLCEELGSFVVEAIQMLMENQNSIIEYLEEREK